jgi:replicative DNA helicase
VRDTTSTPVAEVRADRVPPWDPDAEAALVGSVLYDPSTFALVSWLRPDEFFAEAHNRIFEAAIEISATGKPCDVVAVAGKLRDSGRLSQIGGPAYLAELCDKTPAAADVEAYATRIRALYRRRMLIRACQQTAAESYDARTPTPELIANHEQTVFDLSRDDRGTQSERLGTVIYDVFKRTTEAAKSGDKMVGLETGFERLDDITAGLHNAELTIVAARPGMGKTSLVLNIIRNIASKVVDDAFYGNGAILFSLEMPKDQLAMRWAASEARVDAQKMRKPHTLTDNEWRDLTNASKALYHLPIEIDDTAGIGLVEIGGKCRRAASKFARNGQRLSLVAIDYLQLCRGDRNGNREQEIASLSRGFKELAKQLKVPVIALSQLNRTVETRSTKDKRPQLSDLRESGAIEQDADNIIFIYREDYYDKECDEDLKRVAELIVAKQRNGPTDTVKVRFDSKYTRFDNLKEYHDE